MKFLTILSFLVLSQFVAAQNGGGLKAIKTLDLTSDSFVVGQTQKISISKELFTSHKDAAAYCKNLNLTLIDDASVMVLIMSGAVENKTFADAISFEVNSEGNKISGIVSWLNESKTSKGKVHDVFILQDGAGSDPQSGSLDEFYKILEFTKSDRPKGLKAICTNSEETKVDSSANVNGDDRGHVTEKPTQVPKSKAKVDTSVNQQ